MKLRQITALALAASLSGKALSACSPKLSESVTVTCIQTDTSPQCIAENAEQVLASIEDPFNWATSAVELAISQDSLDNSEAALSLLREALVKTEAIEDLKKRATAYGDMALSFSKIRRNQAIVPLIEQLRERAECVDNQDKKWDILGKLITARAVHEDLNVARKLANIMPSETSSQDAYKGRTQREISKEFAKADKFDEAISIINDIDADFTYYSAVARTDVAAIAIYAGQKDIVKPLLEEAKSIAALQDNGYFSGAILRDIGYNLARLKEMDQAKGMFQKALGKARDAKSDQEKARAISRIATRLADCAMTEQSLEILTEALTITRQIESPRFTNFALYEIAGSAAFSGEFEMANSLIAEIPDIQFGSAVSLKAASQRDLAWGLARDGKIDEAVSVANSITSPREKIHALSRLIRIVKQPEMQALPRYL